jgi:hypothetical protein
MLFPLQSTPYSRCASQLFVPKPIRAGRFVASTLFESHCDYEAFGHLSAYLGLRAISDGKRTEEGERVGNRKY